ncbi:TIGR02677 family protein [Paenactinomyces guangxiensis]|uniref:TIGR02677 family protein n=1 Tax=Paenactinomyces guangxiensis TaxID=1490290 RepID=A0A7W1WP26_9BACL|nr:TIGR02677 family protein [Paenactinomyces guangxiensis]MBA4493431.1 TIGR02677 family protein [Paenactinomyces guangxiensis]MBH8590522.1 TIGR02677 family protein [Paenactinomyces guangxiensis]
MSEGVILEFKYLTESKAHNYRSIITYFYQQHERLLPFIYPEEIYLFLKEIKDYSHYTEEELYRDLDQLVAWGNLERIQETGRFQSIEEFKKKKFIYQLKPKAVEIERMLRTVLQIDDGMSGSLDPTLFERLYKRIVELTNRVGGVYEIRNRKAEEVRMLWNDIHGDFRKLRDDASDYFNRLKSQQIEEKMKVIDYLQFKEAVTEYLRNFMTRLQKTAMQLERVIEDVDLFFLDIVAEKLVEYEKYIPRFDESPPTKEQFLTEITKQWDAFRGWFLGNEKGESYIELLQKRTNETIGRMVRFVQRLGEIQHPHKSRRHDYLHLAKWFADVDTIEEAHRLSACVFGVPDVRHFSIQEPKETESIDREVWDLSPAFYEIKPITRDFRERVKTTAVVDQTEKKQRAIAEFIKKKEEEKRLLENLVSNREIRLRELSAIQPVVRKKLLSWIGKAMAHPEKRAQTENGEKYQIVLASSERIQIKCTDGVLTLPDWIISFK